MTLYGGKWKIFNFELERKFDLHIDLEFDGEFDDYGPKAQKSYFDPLNDPYIIDPLWAKMKVFDFEPEERLDHDWQYIILMKNFTANLILTTTMHQKLYSI